MKIDNKTNFRIEHKYMHVAGTYTITYLTECADLEDMTKAIMLDPAVTGQAIKSMLNQERNHMLMQPGDVIGQACLYLAVCCFVEETTYCRQIISDLVDMYNISIPAYNGHEGTRDILKEIAGIVADKYDNLFNDIAKELKIW